MSDQQNHYKICIFELKVLFNSYFILFLLTVMLFGEGSVHINLTSIINIEFYLQKS